MHNYPGALSTQLWDEGPLVADDKDSFANKQDRKVLMGNIWQLLQYTEYVMSVLFNKQKVFPEVLGKCGHFYAVEQVKNASEI